MTISFGNIPPEVVDFLRQAFARANEKVATQITLNSSVTEPYLDQTFLMEVSAQPQAFFAQSQAVLAIETHWLGSRAMHGRREIADLAVVIKLLASGNAVAQKVALFQTKRLYAWDIHMPSIKPSPLTLTRTRIFLEDCAYEAMSAHSQQVADIDAFTQATNIPVYYGFYNPLEIPYASVIPPTYPRQLPINQHGFRIMPATNVHSKLARRTKGYRPTFAELRQPKLFQRSDSLSTCGWRIENFISDEVLPCHQGSLFDSNSHKRLQALIDTRDNPSLSVIDINIDVPTTS